MQLLAANCLCFSLKMIKLFFSCEERYKKLYSRFLFAFPRIQKHWYVEGLLLQVLQVIGEKRVFFIFDMRNIAEKS